MSLKIKVFISILVAFGSVTVVYLLYVFSTKDAGRNNGFSRFYLKNEISLVKSIDLHYNSYYVAGLTTNNIYLGNTTAPRKITIFDHSLNQKRERILKVEDDLKYSDPKLIVDSPYFYLYDWGMKTILHGRLSDLVAYTFPNAIFFAEAAPISFNSIILRALQEPLRVYFFCKENNTNGISNKANLLIPQIDGSFSTDGMLRYDQKNGLLVYVYYYRNQYLCMDTSLHLLFKANTIDTNRYAKIKLAKIESDHIIKLAEPPLMVNHRCFVSDYYLFINSSLRADNEKVEDFKKASVIDVYNLRTKKYEHSLYLNEIKKNKLSSFWVNGDELIALSGSELYLYHLALKD